MPASFARDGSLAKKTGFPFNSTPRKPLTVGGLVRFSASTLPKGFT
ncbi:MAG: hypothetical protein L0Y60_02720 [Beijerinckiaceae bacterium]|nr:hypothetical protein [Beijerinckiaceae bacterium]